MYRVRRNQLRYPSLSKLKLALAAISSGAALLAGSSFTQAEDSQTCNAGEIFVASPVQDSSQATMMDSNGTPIVTGCAQPRRRPAAIQPLQEQPLQCPAGTFLVGTQVQDSSQATAVDQDGNPFFMSCAQPQSASVSQPQQVTAASPASPQTFSSPASMSSPAPVQASDSAPTSMSSAMMSSVNDGGRRGRRVRNNGDTVIIDNNNNNNNNNNNTTSSNPGKTFPTIPGKHVPIDPGSQFPRFPINTGGIKNNGGGVIVDNNNNNNNNNNSSNAPTVPGTRVPGTRVPSFPIKTGGNGGIRNNGGTVIVDNNNNNNNNNNSSNPTVPGTRVPIDPGKQLPTLPPKSAGTIGGATKQAFNGRFNVASVNGNAGKLGGSKTLAFNTAGLKGGLNSSRFGNFNGRFNTTSLNRGPNAGQQRFNGNSGSRFGGFVQRRVASNNSVGVRTRQFSRARPQFQGFRSSGRRFASFGGGRGGSRGGRRR